MREVGPTAPSLGPDGSVYLVASGEAGIRRLVPTPFSLQAQALADAGEFAEALSLAAMMPGDQVR